MARRSILELVDEGGWTFDYRRGVARKAGVSPVKFATYSSAEAEAAGWTVEQTAPFWTATKDGVTISISTPGRQ